MIFDCGTLKMTKSQEKIKKDIITKFGWHNFCGMVVAVTGASVVAVL